MNGKEFRLKRFLGRSDKLVIAALDHGVFHGPIPGLEDPVQACAQLNGADAVLMGAGILPHVMHQFTSPGAPLLITRLVWNSTYCFQWKHCKSYHRPLMSVEQAVSKGADIVLLSFCFQTGDELVDAENASLFSQYVQEAESLGIPLIGEFFPAKTEEMSQDELHEIIHIGCRVIAELGADVIKTFYTGPKFEEVITDTPVPVLVLGAEKTPTEREALQLAADAASSGARGIVFGRNIVQSRHPAGFIAAVREVINNGLPVADALTKYGLEETIAPVPNQMASSVS
ncbi:MAG: class I fructose-bisphosphate aldolase [Armatimonadota bacterium]